MNNINHIYREFFNIKKNNDSKIEEADLLNNMTDYKGGILYKLIDPAQAPLVRNNIQQFASKKKMHIIKTKFDDKRGLGFFYFRLGEDPGKESQRIQGYISQLPEVSRFKFTTLPKPVPPPASQQDLEI